jgi:hypothetical protein
MKGQVTVLDFVAPNSGVSMLQLARLENIRRIYEGRGVQFTAVRQTMRKRFSKEEAGSIIRATGFQGQLIHDPDNAIGGQFSVRTFPTLFVVGTDARVADVIMGNVKDLEQRLRFSLETALAGGKPARAKSDPPKCDLANLPPVPRHQPASIAVMDFDVKDLGPDAGRALADLARSTVAGSNRYLLLDREDMVNILGEEDFAAAVRCDKTKCLVNYGKKLRAQKLCHGRVNKLGESFVVTIKITDVSSGKVDAFRTERMSGSIDDAMDYIGPLTCVVLRDALTAG